MLIQRQKPERPKTVLLAAGLRHFGAMAGPFPHKRRASDKLFLCRPAAISARGQESARFQIDPCASVRRSTIEDGAVVPPWARAGFGFGL